MGGRAAISLLKELWAQSLSRYHKYFVPTGLRERLQRLLQLPLDQSFLQFVAFPPPETSATEATS